MRSSTMDKILKICNRLHNKQFLYKLASEDLDEDHKQSFKDVENYFFNEHWDEMEKAERDISQALKEDNEFEDLVIGINDKLELLKRKIEADEYFKGDKEDALAVLDLVEDHVNERNILSIRSAIVDLRVRKFSKDGLNMGKNMSEESRMVDDIIHDLQRAIDILQNESLVDPNINPDQISEEDLDPTNTYLNPEDIEERDKQRIRNDEWERYLNSPEYKKKREKSEAESNYMDASKLFNS